LVDKLGVLEVDSLGATIIEVETEMIHEFLPDKVAEDVIEVPGAIIVAPRLRHLTTPLSIS